MALFASNDGYEVRVASDIEHGSLTVVSGMYRYRYGETVTLAANPDEGYALMGFAVADIINGVIQTPVPLEGDSFTMPGNDVAVTAVFWPLYNIGLAADPSEGGTVSGGGAFENGASVTVTATANDGYAFTGWTEGDTVVSTDASTTFTATGDRTLTANFERMTYTVKFVNEDGAELQSSEIVCGETPAYTGATPEKAATAQYSYSFAGWTPEITSVTGAATYTATYTETVNKYTVKFVNDDDTELQSSEIAYGETPAYTGETPTKPATAQYSYTFAGWTPEITSVTGAATYTAAYTETVNEYTVSFETGGSAVTTQTLKYGEKPIKPSDPTKEGHAFDGWFADEALTKPFDFTAPIEGATAIYPKWTPNDYRLKSVTGTSADASHSWTKGSGADVILTAALDVTPDHSFDHYDHTEIDGRTVPAAAREGSTIVTIKAAELQRLSVGAHTVTVVFDNGSMDVRLTVRSDPRHPSTGDDAEIFLWAAMAALSLSSVAALALAGRKRRPAKKG